MSEYIGRPQDETSGTIREALINYNPHNHDPIESAIDAIPHARFVLFDGPSQEQLIKMIGNLGVELAKEGQIKLLDEWKAVHGQGDLLKSLGYCNQLIKRRHVLELKDQTSFIEYRNVVRVLEMSALFFRAGNYKTSAACGKSSQQLQDKFKGRVEIVNIDYPVNEWARDSIFSLQRDGKRVLIPSRKYYSEGIAAQLPLNQHAQANNHVWDRLGYQRTREPNLDGFQGGQIAANRSHAFVGVNALHEAVVAVKKKNDSRRPHESYTDEDTVYEELDRITSGLAVHEYNDKEISPHIDILAMPINDNAVFVGDFAQTYTLLSRHGLANPKDVKLVKPYTRLLRSVKQDLEQEGFDVVSVPFWISEQYPELQYLFSYCNILQEDKTIYTPRRDEHQEVGRYAQNGNKNQTARMNRIGRLLDEKFAETASRYKNVVTLSGFNAAGNWSSSGLRCLVNVLYRE